MIVPSRRLLVAAGLLLAPAAALTTALPSAALVPGILVAALTLAAVADACRAGGALAGVAVTAPLVVRLTVDRAGAVPLTLANETGRSRQLRVALALPAGIDALRPVLHVELPEDGSRTSLEFPCRPWRRGAYPVEQCCLEGASPLGLWATRITVPLTTELRVYPNLAAERKSLAALFLHRGGFGVHTQRQVGSGREFEKLREYVPGDSYEDIHWKATARRGRPITKVNQIERTQEVYVVVDASRLSTRTPGNSTQPAKCGGTVLDRFVNAALVLGLAAERQGDLFGVVAFTDRVVRMVRAKGGKIHYGSCRDALYTLQPRDVTPDYDELFATLGLRLRRRSLLVFLGSLDDPALAVNFARNVKTLSRRHVVLVIMLRPEGTGPLFSDAGVASVNDLYERLAGHLQWSDLQALRKTLGARGVGFSMLDDTRLCGDVVSQYLAVKRRQLL